MNSRNAIGDLPSELTIMIANHDVPVTERTFPSIADGPTYPTISALALTDSEMYNTLYPPNKSVLFATGLDSLALSPHAHQRFWDDIKSGTVKHLVFAVGDFEKAKRCLESLSTEAPEHAVTKVTVDERFRITGDAALSNARDVDITAVARAMFAERGDDLPTTVQVRSSSLGRGRSDCAENGLNLYRLLEEAPFSSTTSYRSWGNMRMTTPGRPWWSEKSSLAPRFNFNIAAVAVDKLSEVFSRFCKDRAFLMQHIVGVYNIPSILGLG